MPLKVKNIAAGYYANGKFHPIRASADYDPERVEESFDYARIGKKARKEKAKRAAEIAKAARAAARAAKKVSASSPKTKKASRKRSVSGAAKLAARKARKKNPIPTNRWVPAKVRRTKSGDIKLILPL